MSILPASSGSPIGDLGAVIEVRRQGDEALLGELVGGAADLVVQAPPLLDDDDSRSIARVGRGQVATGGATVTREFDVLTGHAYVSTSSCAC